MQYTSSLHAEQLLLAHCTTAQRRAWQATRTIPVRGSCGGMFVVNGVTGETHGMRRMLWLRWRERWCCVLGRSVPLEDRVLAIKLLLEANEGRFRRVANPLNRKPLVAYAGLTFACAACAASVRWPWLSGVGGIIIWTTFLWLKYRYH
jgi:hypothetical protein